MLGCLVEKEATVPDSYPMTTNALRSACNQRSSRDPVVDWSEHQVVEAADGLRAKGLARLVHQPGGRAAKHRHRADEELVLDEPSLAVLSVLLLRGPQTVGELRGRTDRQFAFDSLDEVAHVLDRLANRDEPLVALLPRRPGQKDARWCHLLGGLPAEDTADGDDPPEEAPAPPSDLEGRVHALEQQVAELRAALGLTDEDA